MLSARLNNNLAKIYFMEGSVAKQVVPAAGSETYWQRKRREKAEREAAESVKRAVKKEKKLFAFAISLCIVIAIAGCWLAVSTQAEYQHLSMELGDLKDEYDTMLAQNNSKAYEIAASVNYSDIVRIATEELGMVRADSSQMIVYKVDDDKEYIEFAN